MRFGKSVWHARRINALDEEIAEYSAPTEIITRPNYLSVMPASSRGYLELIKSGETLFDTWTATANGMFFDGVFKAGDLMWVDGEYPLQAIEDEYGNGASATAVVVSALEVNTTIEIRLERNQRQVKK